ncbi:DUF1538 domain-containing protein [Desulfonatronum parangueonense]
MTEQFWFVIKTVLPLLFILLLLELAFGYLGMDSLLDLMAGSVMIMAGLVLFLQGVNVAVIPLGRAIGSQLPQKTSTAIVIMFSFFLALVINASDPAVHILAGHVDTITPDESVSPLLLIACIALGIGSFICLALFRVLLGIRSSIVFAVGYGLVLVLAFFTPEEFVPLAFDAGGIATGPLTVPFILSFGVGFVSVLGKSSDDSFGLLGLAALGPILGIMLLGVFVL